jgi:DNA primase
MAYEETHALARTVCEHLERKHPARLTTEWGVAGRRGKVFLDYNQNREGKTLAAAYSPRAVVGGTVSAPVTWEELNTVRPEEMTIRTVPERLRRVGDPWEGMMAAAVDLGRRLRAA